MNRPEVIVIQEASLDGKLAVSADRPLLFGDDRWESLRGEKAFDIFKWLMTNHRVQATLEGSNSFLPENQTPTELPPFEGNDSFLYQDYLPPEILEREGHRGWFTAVDSRGRIRWVYKDGYPGDDVWDGWHALVFVSGKTPPAYLSYLRQELIPYLVCGENRIDLGIALEKLKTRLQVNTLLSTAGGILNGKLLQYGLVDEINVELLPGVIGGGQAPSLFRGLILGDEQHPVPLELISCMVTEGNQVWLRYRLKNHEYPVSE
jgi:riboflavin biosynthesis pyrimidine reductase